MRILKKSPLFVSYVNFCLVRYVDSLLLSNDLLFNFELFQKPTTDWLTLYVFPVYFVRMFLLFDIALKVICYHWSLSRERQWTFKLVLFYSIVQLRLDPIIPLKEWSAHLLSLFIKLFIMVVPKQLDQSILLWMGQDVGKISHLEKLLFACLTRIHFSLSSWYRRMIVREICIFLLAACILKKEAFLFHFQVVLSFLSFLDRKLFFSNALLLILKIFGWTSI